MKNECPNFINLSTYEENIVNTTSTHKLDDPLEGTSNELLEPKYYKVDRIVFAEPINMRLDEETIEETEIIEENNKEDLVFTDNVIVQKRKGKRNKYHINFKEDINCCPQQNCTKRFPKTSLLKAHIRKVHCADKSRYICEYCSAGFSAEYLLRRHLSTHQLKRVQCAVCFEMLSERTDMRVHLQSHAGVRKHQCKICKKKFTRSSVLATHVKFVHREGQLICDLCGESFASRSEWSRHKTTHNSRASEKTSSS